VCAPYHRARVLAPAHVLPPDADAAATRNTGAVAAGLPEEGADGWWPVASSSQLVELGGGRRRHIYCMSAPYSRTDEAQLDVDDTDRQMLLSSPDGIEGETSSSSLPQPAPTTVQALLGVPRYPFVLLAGLLFDFARIGLAFLGPYYMNGATHSPRLVQLVGAASWAFLIFGPCFGVVSDRLDRRRTVLMVLAVESLAAVLVGLLLVNSLMQPWFMFVYMAQSSMCSVLDTTNRPAMIYDLLFQHRSEHLVGKAMALRSIGSNCGRIFGNQVIGWAVETVGVGATYSLVASLLAAAGMLLCLVPSPPKASSEETTRGGRHHHREVPSRPQADAAAATAGARAGVWTDLATGLAFAWKDKAFLSMLGVTFFANFHYWSHQPLLQVLATRLGADASQTGLLVSASGWGGLLASVLVTTTNPSRTGLLYCLGIAAADAVLPGATILNFWVAFASLAGSGFLAGLFGAVQSAMVMSMVPDHLRGRAMGMLTMVIGAGPFGMATLGELAERLGPALALQGFALAGVVGQLLWFVWRPQALWIRSPSKK
jgi:predicted MFS family arabinose efflux permease